ncbi:hypothetical protein Cgig2_011793 [Carnegiea gigantea]|uniref:Uncharacterized protein n=1 Tax=Carnegiea gigantea TaxID=171969 RepID=A0A9Q1GS09_9CARY|nr:hypothetical protein Cgig2_011793 [Carnegiea gigantea]
MNVKSWDEAEDERHFRFESMTLIIQKKKEGLSLGGNWKLSNSRPQTQTPLHFRSNPNPTKIAAVSAAPPPVAAGWRSSVGVSRRLCSVVSGGSVVGGVIGSVLWWSSRFCCWWSRRLCYVVGGSVLWWAAQCSVATGWPASAMVDAFTGSSQ